MLLFCDLTVVVVAADVTTGAAIVIRVSAARLAEVIVNCFFMTFFLSFVKIILFRATSNSSDLFLPLVKKNNQNKTKTSNPL